MTVLSPVVETWDGTNRRIYLKQGVENFYPIEDIYHEYRYERRTNENFRKYEPLLRAEGNIPKGAGAFTPRYVVLIDGTKIIPYDESLRLNQLGEIITDDPDTDPTLYDISTLTNPKVIFIQPSEAEIIQLNTESIVYSSFQNGVWYDSTSSYSDIGTDIEPNGNAERPVNSISLAIQIANTRGYSIIYLNSNLNANGAYDLSNFKLIGKTRSITLTVSPSVTANNIIIERCTVDGTFDLNTTIEDCFVEDLNNFNGAVYHSGLYGTINLGGAVEGENDESLFVDCFSTDQDDIPIIDVGGDNDVNLVNYAGNIVLQNLSASGSEATVGLNSGTVTLSDSISAGEVVISGTGLLVDNSTGDVEVNSDGLMSKETVSTAVWDEQLGTHTIVDTTGYTLAQNSFDNKVWINTTIGTSGTTFPIGTRAHPSNNITDALIIGTNNNIGNFYVRGSIELSGSHVEKHFESGAGTEGHIDFNGCNLTNCIFESISIAGSGSGSGYLSAIDCDILSGLTGFSIGTTTGTLGGTFTLPASGTYQGDGNGVIGATGIIVNLNGTGSFNMQRMSGIITMMNATSSLCILGLTGHFILTLHPTCTAGTLLTAGIGELVDYSSGMTIVDYVVPATVWDRLTASHGIAGSFAERISKIKKETGLVPGLV